MEAHSSHWSLAILKIPLGTCKEGSFPWHQGVLLGEALVLLLCVAPQSIAFHGPWLCPPWGVACFLPVESWGSKGDFKEEQTVHSGRGDVGRFLSLSDLSQTHVQAENYLLNSLRCAFFSRRLYSYLERIGLLWVHIRSPFLWGLPLQICVYHLKEERVSFAQYSQSAFVLQVCVGFSTPGNSPVLSGHRPRILQF